MAKRTPEEEVAHQMQKMKDMGVTISTSPPPGVWPESQPRRVADVIADAAKEAGIYEEKN